MTPPSALNPPSAAPAGLPQEAYAAALAHLPGIGPARLVALLGEDNPQSLWRRVGAGEIVRPPRVERASPPGHRLSWAEVAARRDVAATWRAMRAGAINVAYRGGEGFPSALARDPEPPGVIFWLGALGAALSRPRVAVIGTRQCTGYGRSVAAELGRDLAECGVCVVSGLALGIDGAAHHGALRVGSGAGPLGVAASGVDRPYPLTHTDLWHQVASAGAIVSETPPGQPAQSWRFPARNRLIAALAHAVVVVESHGAGGSMLTVAAAANRGIDLLAVPGPVTSASSIGTNQLLHEGVAPARHAGDVLAVLGDLRPWPARPASLRRAPTRSRRDEPRPPAMSASQGSDPPPGKRSRAYPEAARAGRVDPAGRRVLGAIDRTPTATSVIAERTGLPLGLLSVVLLDLEGRHLVRGQGIWWERCEQV